MAQRPHHIRHLPPKVHIVADHFRAEVYGGVHQFDADVYGGRTGGFGVTIQRADSVAIVSIAQPLIQVGKLLRIIDLCDHCTVAYYLEAGQRLRYLHLIPAQAYVVAGNHRLQSRWGLRHSQGCHRAIAEGRFTHIVEGRNVVIISPFCQIRIQISGGSWILNLRHHGSIAVNVIAHKRAIEDDGRNLPIQFHTVQSDHVCCQVLRRVRHLHVHFHAVAGV